MTNANTVPPIDHVATDEIVCPHCGHVHTDSWERRSDSDENDECAECGKLFGWERETDVTYSSYVPQPKKPEPVRVAPPLPDFERDKASTATPRTGEIAVIETALHVWEEECSPDEKILPVLYGILCHLGWRGFEITRDAQTLKHYPTLANNCWVGERRGLRFVATVSGRHLEVVFYQDEHTNNRNGGRYSFGKLALMPERMRLVAMAEMVALVRYALGFGYGVSKERGLLGRAPLALEVRDSMTGNYLRRETPLEHYRRHWGSNRHNTDERGFMLMAEMRWWPWALKDRDGVPLTTGDTRFTYKGGSHRLKRVTIYPEPNGQWLCDANGELFMAQGNDLFLCDPTAVPRRLAPDQHERLKKEALKAFEEGRYARLETLARVLGRL